MMSDLEKGKNSKNYRLFVKRPENTAVESMVPQGRLLQFKSQFCYLLIT